MIRLAVSPGLWLSREGRRRAAHVRPPVSPTLSGCYLQPRPARLARDRVIQPRFRFKRYDNPKPTYNCRQPQLTCYNDSEQHCSCANGGREVVMLRTTRVVEQVVGLLGGPRSQPKPTLDGPDSIGECCYNWRFLSECEICS